MNYWTVILLQSIDFWQLSLGEHLATNYDSVPIIDKKFPSPCSQRQIHYLLRVCKILESPWRYLNLKIKIQGLESTWIWGLGLDFCNAFSLAVFKLKITVPSWKSWETMLNNFKVVHANLSKSGPSIF